MNYWSALKYVLTFVFLFIIAVGIYMAQNNTASNQSNVPQTSQSKFNI